MKKSILFLAMMALVMSVSITSCSPSSIDNGTSGEGAETGGSEGVGNEQGESGMVWGVNQTADEVISGIHAVIYFSAATNSFQGTFENLNSNIAQQSRLEVHIIDANGNTTEFGPTPGVDMQPGIIRDVVLPIAAGASFVSFTMHAEVGVAGNGG